MKVTAITLFLITLSLAGCGSGSSDSGSDTKTCSDYKIYAGDLYRFMKGEVELYREATDKDYEKYCELDTSPI